MSAYTVKLDTFEGPLDLLLELIEREELDISDVSLARITDEFLGYLSHFEKKEPAFLADFLLVSAKLILLKSKTLLPSFAVTKEEEAELTHLKEKLAEYQKIRRGSRAIAALGRMKHIAYHRPSSLRHIVVFRPPPGATVHTLHELFTAALRMRQEETLAILPPEEQTMSFIVSFEKKLNDVRARLTETLEQSFSALYDASAKVDIIIAFLAVLELIKQCFMKAEQKESFGEIRLTRIIKDTHV